MTNVRYVQKSLLRFCVSFKRPLSSSATSEVDLNFRLLQDDLKGINATAINKPGTDRGGGGGSIFIL